MNRKITGAIAALSMSASLAHAIVIIDETTTGYYNAAIGTALNGTGPAFPTSGDPTLSFPADFPEPDLSSASVALGTWLGASAPSGGGWSGPGVAIPSTWAVGTETAIVYAFDAGSGLDSVELLLGVDNGIHVWLDGNYIGGEMAPGGAAATPPGEYSFALGSLSGGTHFLQLLREDHGGGTGYDIQLSGTVRPAGVPENGASIALLLIACGGMFSFRKLTGS